jgi:hypothetical protein
MYYEKRKIELHIWDTIFRIRETELYNQSMIFYKIGSLCWVSFYGPEPCILKYNRVSKRKSIWSSCAIISKVEEKGHYRPVQIMPNDWETAGLHGLLLL